MYNRENTDYKKLFLNIEKLLIDFRLNKLDSEDYKFECTSGLSQLVENVCTSKDEKDIESIVEELVNKRMENVDDIIVKLNGTLEDFVENLDQKIVEKIQEVLSGDLKLVVEDKNFHNTLRKVFSEKLKELDNEEDTAEKAEPVEVAKPKTKSSYGKISVGGTKFKVFEELHLNTVSKNTDGNTVEYNKDKVAEQAETISAALG